MRAGALIGLVIGALVCGCAGVADSVCSGALASEERGLVLPTWERNGYSSTDTAGALQGISSVGANWVQIVPTWYQPTSTASEIGPTDSSVTDDDVRQVIGLARRDGLKVLLKPHVDSADGTRRTSIEPSDLEAWFRSYQAFIIHYADLAREQRVDQFSVGTELGGLSSDRDEWLAVIQQVRNHYEGPLIYAANYDEYSDVTFWDAIDLVGIDAYWSLKSQATADVSQLANAFALIRDELAEFARKVNRRILFTEAGYPSQVGSATEPWYASPRGRPANDEQAAAYEALLKTFTGQPWWAGVFWWTWDVQHLYSVDTPDAISHSVQGKLAESVLRRWWTDVFRETKNGCG
jgi:hypothetical protein